MRDDRERLLDIVEMCDVWQVAFRDAPAIRTQLRAILDSYPLDG